VAAQMEKLAAVYLEERRKLEAAEAGRRAREGLTVVPPSKKERERDNNNSSAAVAENDK
jgi:hypothetical protein